MTDLRPTIVPKSDQLNSDDLIGRSITVKITKVALCGEADQPIAVHYEGDGGKPYKPCKSMRRVMVSVWGSDGNEFVGRALTLYRDEKVQFGGLAVGGIRISHMSHIDRDITLALTATRANRKPFTVKPLRMADTARPRQADGPKDDFPGDRPSTTREASGEATQPGAGGPTLTLDQRVKLFDQRISLDVTETKLISMWTAAALLRAELERDHPEELQGMKDRFDARLDEVKAAAGGEQF